jgi:hypothetical protein
VPVRPEVWVPNPSPGSALSNHRALTCGYAGITMPTCARISFPTDVPPVGQPPRQ